MQKNHIIMTENIFSIIIPFIGTVLGAACVFFVKKELKPSVQKAFSGFAAGVMIAASIWSLIIPSFESSNHLGKLSFIPVIVGLWVGFLFLIAYLTTFDSYGAAYFAPYAPYVKSDIKDGIFKNHG